MAAAEGLGPTSYGGRKTDGSWSIDPCYLPAQNSNQSSCDYSCSQEYTEEEEEEEEAVEDGEGVARGGSVVVLKRVHDKGRQLRRNSLVVQGVDLVFVVGKYGVLMQTAAVEEVAVLELVREG